MDTLNETRDWNHLLFNLRTPVTKLKTNNSHVYAACFRRSDSGERCKISISETETGEEILVARISFLCTAPHYLNTW